METAIRTKTEILIHALKILSNEIESEDGIANTAILEGAQRLDELNKKSSKTEQGMSINNVFPIRKFLEFFNKRQ